MGAGPLHLLKSGLAVRLEEEGHHVTIRAVELPPEFRATEIASAFELGAALARGVAEALQTGAFPLVSIGKLWTGGLGLRWWAAKPDEDLLVRRSWRFQYTGNHS